MAATRSADILNAQLAELAGSPDGTLAGALRALLESEPSKRRAQPAAVWAGLAFVPSDEPWPELLTAARHRLGEPWADAVGWAGGQGLGAVTVRTPELLARVTVEAARVASAGGVLQRAALTAAVRFLATAAAKAHPGQSVELRLPPAVAVQLGHPQAGPVHTRGTPPNVVETDPETFLQLAVGALDWQRATAAHRVSASGNRSDLGWLLPITAPAAGSTAPRP